MRLSNVPTIRDGTSSLKVSVVKSHKNEKNKSEKDFITRKKHMVTFESVFSNKIIKNPGHDFEKAQKLMAMCSIMFYHS